VNKPRKEVYNTQSLKECKNKLVLHPVASIKPRQEAYKNFYATYDADKELRG